MKVLDKNFRGGGKIDAFVVNQIVKPYKILLDRREKKCNYGKELRKIITILGIWRKRL